MNIWHNIDSKRITVEDFIVMIEISKASKVKYELDKQTGLMILDRVLKTSMQYPANYGFVPRTLCTDGDPLDVFVLGNESIQSGTIVQCYPVGIIKFVDQGIFDEKIIAIPYCDFQYNHYRDITELPSHICPEIEHFLAQYKFNENKPVQVGKTQGKDKAIKYIKESIERYKSRYDNTNLHLNNA